MKKLVIVLFMALLSASYLYARSQRYYCEVKGIEKGLSTSLKITLDFGDKASTQAWGAPSSKLKFVDEQGEEMDFKSMVDAANYMIGKGWNFQQAYSSSQNERSVIHWIFYKDAESFGNAREGIMTKDEYNKKQK